MSSERIAILGRGNRGSAIARGLVSAGARTPEAITITRRFEPPLAALRDERFRTTTDNTAAVQNASVVVVAVRPKQMDDVLEGIASALDAKRHVLISTATDVQIADIRARVGEAIPILRAMPNIGVAVGEAMTCPTCERSTPDRARDAATAIFSALGRTAFLDEDQMTPAPALCACGIAFFLRAIRVASQGDVQVGFHADEAIRLAAQTAKGAAELILARDAHPESLIDTVTTPLGGHDCRSERDGASRVLLRADPRHRGVGRAGPALVREEGRLIEPRTRSCTATPKLLGAAK